MRYLFSGRNKCHSNCSYCFAKWNDEYIPTELFNIETIDNSPDEIIVYPCCDSDFFNQVDVEYIIDMLLTVKRKVYVSISTKNSINRVLLERIQKLDHYLRSNDYGFVKISVSFSTKYKIDEIEQYTLSYSERLMLLKSLTDNNLYTSIIIKPVLPFVSVNEYTEIIDDCANIINKGVIGGLYTNKESEFYKKYIKDQFKTVKRKVNWLPQKTVWDYIEEKDKLSYICDYAKSKSFAIYNSDIELIKSLCVE